MDTTINFYGTVVNGKMMHYKPGTLANHLSTLEGKEFQMNVVERESANTPSQHSFYRYGIIKVTCMQTDLFAGWREDEIHEFFSDKFLSIEATKTLDDEVVIFKKKRSTSNLSKKQLSKYIEDVLNFLAQYNIYPLPPEEYQLDKYKSDEPKQRKNQKEPD